jgi:hypothetical protein
MFVTEEIPITVSRRAPDKEAKDGFKSEDTGIFFSSPK